MKDSQNSIALIYSLICSLTILLICGTDVVGAQATNQTKLRIAVPPKTGFTGLVKIERDPHTDKVNFSGFAIEVFTQAFAAAVDKSITYEFIAYEKPDGTMNGTYDEMVQAVFREEYDGAVGDRSIRYSRTQWVDFTIPYTDTGISMLIPLRQQITDSTLPMTKNIVIAALVILFVGLIIVVMEVLKYIRRPPPRPAVGREVYVSHIQELKDELVKVIKSASLVRLLCFLVLVFLISYHAANLTSLLTKEQARTPTKSLNQLIRTGEKVGYLKNAFTVDLLKNYGFPDNQLLPYETEEQLHDMLSKGNKGGGIAVAIDKTIPLTIFIAQHCNQYVLVPTPNLHAYGFAYAFSKKNPRLVQDVSTGIAKLFDNGQLGRIQARTIGGSGTCDVEQDIEPDDNGGDTFMGNFMDKHTRNLLCAGAIACLIFVLIAYGLYVYNFFRKG